MTDGHFCRDILFSGGPELSRVEPFSEKFPVPSLEKSGLRPAQREFPSTVFGKVPKWHSVTASLVLGLGGLNPEQGIIEKTVDRLLYDSDDVESSIVKEIPEFLTPGVAI
jgi:hypothetical protein